MPGIRGRQQGRLVGRDFRALGRTAERDLERWWCHDDGGRPGVPGSLDRLRCTSIKADTGEQLAAINLGVSIMAAPMTYELDGVQYVAIMAGFGGALGGTFPKSTAAYKYGNAGKLIVLRSRWRGPVPLPPEVVREAKFARRPPRVPESARDDCARNGSAQTPLQPLPQQQCGDRAWCRTCGASTTRPTASSTTSCSAAFAPTAAWDRFRGLLDG